MILAYYNLISLADEEINDINQINSFFLDHIVVSPKDFESGKLNADAESL